MRTALHARQVIAQVPPGFPGEVFPSVELGQSQVGRGAVGVDAEDFSA